MRSDAPTLALMAALAACTAAGSGGCARDNTGTSEAVSPAATEDAAPLPPAATMHPDDLKDVTASYDCDGIRVDLVRDQVARVNLAVDNIVKIERIAGSAPPTYQDVGLTLIVTGTGANLDDETGRSVSCEAIAKPGGA